MTSRLMLKPGQSAKCIEALKALHAAPLSPDELATYNSQRAAEMARAEAARRSEPQLELITK